jgi:hypothetical protein
MLIKPNLNKPMIEPPNTTSLPKIPTNPKSRPNFSNQKPKPKNQANPNLSSTHQPIQSINPKIQSKPFFSIIEPIHQTHSLETLKPTS